VPELARVPRPSHARKLPRKCAIPKSDFIVGHLPSRHFKLLAFFLSAPLNPWQEKSTDKADSPEVRVSGTRSFPQSNSGTLADFHQSFCLSARVEFHSDRVKLPGSSRRQPLTGGKYQPTFHRGLGIYGSKSRFSRNGARHATVLFRKRAIDRMFIEFWL
jgi:hypothetical protein